MEGLVVSDMASITCSDSVSSVMSLGETRVSDPGVRHWGPGSSESSCQASLVRGMIEGSLIFYYFAREKFSCVSNYEYSSTRFFQFTGTVTFILCSTVGNVLSKTTWYWGGTFPVLVFNTRATYPE